jgi:hypothetical protein
MMQRVVQRSGALVWKVWAFLKAVGAQPDQVNV